jgi:hypothetical protein
MAINSVPEGTVALGIRVPAAGEYTIHWDNQVSAKTAFLHDNLNSEPINMTEHSTYTFSTSTGNEINNRFSISFAPNAPTGKQEISHQISVSSSNGFIILDGLIGNSVIRLYNMLGKRITQGSTQSATYQIPLSNKGVYIVEINSENRTTRKKVISQ